MTRFKKYISIILVGAIMLCFAGCSKDVTSADTFFMEKEDAATDVLATVSDTSLFCDITAFKELVRVSKTDMTALCFSEESLSPSVYDSGSNKLWRSLPEVYMGENAGVICITLLIGGNEYTLNSQSDCKVNDGITYEINEDSIKINYTFNKKLSDGTVIDITVPVLYKGADGTVSVSVDCSAIDMGKTGEGVILSSISLLPWLGAFEGVSEGDFLFISDGSGALVDTGVPSESTRSYEVAVYSDGEGASAIMPVFGMKSGEAAFVAVIDEGDALAKIRAHKASAEEGSNRVYAEFTVIPTEKTDEGYYVSSVGYKGNIRLSYRFISKENADYTAMATVARELMIRNGSLVTGSGLTGAYPLNLSLIGASSSRVYTDFAQCYDVLTTLGSRGINNINLRYRGIFGGGTEQESGTDLNEKLGDDGQLAELESLVSAQGVNIYAETNLFAFSDSPEDASLDIRGEGYEKELIGFEGYKADIFSPASVNERASSMLYGHRESFFSGLCINDAGYFLPADYSKGEVILLTDAAKELSAQINGISATKGIAVNRGNLYAIKYADMIFELPDTSFYGEEDSCRQIPFVQIVLHGICDYSLSAINLADDSTDAFLRAVEYGAVPYYEWYCENTAEGAEDKYYYMNSVSAARQQYEKAGAALSDLRGSRITDHGIAAENVYFTVYDNETEIYVNYSDEAVTVSGVTIEAKSFIRVN